MTYRNKRAALEACIKEMENYKGYIGCDPEYTKHVYIIQKRINEGKLRATLSPQKATAENTFSAMYHAG